jgi:hypothetical protein
MAAKTPHWSVENEDKSTRWTRSGGSGGTATEEFSKRMLPGEQMPQGGEHTGSPGVGGGDCSGAQHQVDSATESLTNTVESHLVPIYQVIGLSVAVALLMLLLMSILRMVLDIMIRAITMARVRSCRWWLMGAF